MDSKLAHDLNNDEWRSDDVSIGAFRSHANQIEIITPNEISSRTTRKDTNSTNRLLPNVNSTFSSIKISTQIVEDLKRCGFVRPSPIQATSIPLGRIGIDLIAQSKSGTGKTIVFVVCALEMILQALHEPPSPRVLIVAPTREIAVQIGEIIDALTSSWTGISCYKAIGGTKVSDNLLHLSTSQIIVGTPGRICCLLEMDLLKPNSIRLLVLDECDKLMEDSFKKQIDKLFGFLPANKQMIVTSATMSDEMTLFLANYMRSPALVRLNADNPALIGVMQLYHLTEGHLLDYLNFEAKMTPLLAILDEISFSQCVIFCNYQTRAKYLYDRLVAAKWTTTHISGDMTQKERNDAINAFRRHKCRILVSTDLTSRGIDIHTVNLIINLDVPIDSETYLHRIGRAGRFGSAGIAITLVGSDHDKFMNIIDEYKLDVHQLTLPIKVNLWNSFYHNRLDRDRQQLMKNWKEGLPVNELFASVINNYAQLCAQSMNEPTTDVPFEFKSFCAPPFANVLDDSNTDLHYERTFLNTLLSSQVTHLEESLTDVVLEDSGLSKDYEVDLRNSYNSSPICASMPEEKCESRDEQHFASVTTDEMRMKQLFKGTFLRPFLSARRNYSTLINPDVSICKYLLKGGSHAPT